MNNKQIIGSLIKIVKSQQLILQKIVTAYQKRHADLTPKFGQYTVPLTNPPGKQLQVDPDTGKPFYINDSELVTKPGTIPPASLSGPSSITSNKPLNSSSPNSQQTQVVQRKQMPPEWLRQYMYLEKVKEWAEVELKKMNDELAKDQTQDGS